uniref:guanylate kinase n=2 Tax=Kalanchoe fedtschenkoi TaxID=63787 RepID=A0A7N0VKE5_KALFE
MGEAPIIFEKDLLQKISNETKSVSIAYEAVVAAANKQYLVGGTDESGCSIGVQILDQTTRKWTTPVILGDKPEVCKDQSVIVLNEERMLVIRRDAALEDSLWFLEFNTKFVRDQRQALDAEVVAWSKGVIGEDLKPVVISGPSGVGKGTLISKLMEDFPTKFGFSVSHTTRAPRQKEQNGVHYHFSERSAMEKDIKDGKFLEFALVHDNLYGTSVEAVEVVADAGKRCILDIDVQGARQVRASPLGATFIFIRPPSFAELENRLRARGTETEEQVQKRLRNAKAEIEQGLSSGIFDHILENDDLEECYRNLKKLLGLDVIPDVCRTSQATKPHLSMNHLEENEDGRVVVVDHKNNKFALDVSCIRGGAPGRTRGLKLHPLSNGGDQTDQFII